MRPAPSRKSCNLTPVTPTDAAQDGSTSFYLILPTAGISVTRRTAALFHAPVAISTREGLSPVHTRTRARSNTQGAIERANMIIAKVARSKGIGVAQFFVAPDTFPSFVRIERGLETFLLVSQSRLLRGKEREREKEKKKKTRTRVSFDTCFVGCASARRRYPNSLASNAEKSFARSLALRLQRVRRQLATEPGESSVRVH